MSSGSGLAHTTNMARFTCGGDADRCIRPRLGSGSRGPTRKALPPHLIPAGQEGLVEPALDSEIAIVPGGPLWVGGGVSVESADGTPWEVQNRRTLCRCGASNNKPFCDGAHSDLHFDER